MNTNESDLKRPVVCTRCSYNANPLGVKRCQKCGKRLAIAYVPNNNLGEIDFVPYVFLLFLVLMFFIFGGFGYYYGQELRSPRIASNRKSSSDIQLYNSMKEVPNVPEGTFNYGGGLLLASLTASGTHAAIAKAYPQFHLRYTAPLHGNPGSGSGIAMLIDGQLSFVVSGRPVEDAEYSKASIHGFRLDQIPFAIDAISFFVHPGVSISGLSVDQLKAIFKGEITNWKQVEGPDLPIVVISLSPQAAAPTKVFLGPEVNSLSPKAHIVYDSTTAIRTVASTPGAISLGPISLIANQRTVRPLAVASANSKQYVQVITDDGRINAEIIRNSTYPVTRRLFAVIRRDDTPDNVAGVAYANLLLSKEGQTFVEKAGFIPLR